MRLKWVLGLISLGIGSAILFYWTRGDAPSSLGTQISTSAPITTAPVDETLSPDQHPLDPLLDKAQGFLDRFHSEVQDYTATIVKRERIGGRLSDESQMIAKIRTASPNGGLACYLKFVSPASSKDREVIWVEGENDGKIISHEGGFKNWKRFELDPDGMLAMLGNRYPITQIGLKRLIEKLIEKGKEDRNIGPCQVQTIPNQEIGARACTLYQIVHPDKDERYDFHIAQIFIDDELQIPLRYAAFSWPDTPESEPLLEEEYTYLDVQLNVGLTDADFDPDNDDYAFP